MDSDGLGRREYEHTLVSVRNYCLGAHEKEARVGGSF